MGVLPDGGICPTCGGTGLDLARRAATPFTAWARAGNGGSKGP